MDPDLVVERLISGLLLLGGALVVGWLATWLVGWVCRRASVSAGFTLLAQVLTPVLLLYSASLYLDVSGIAVAGRVKSTEERISYGSRIPGAWSRSFWATVRVDTPEAAEFFLWIDEETYDALRPDSPIVIRYLPGVPFIARPAERSTRSLVPWRRLAIGGLVLASGLALRVLLRPLVPQVVQGVLLFTAVAMAVIWWVFPTPWETPLAPPVSTAIAEVKGVREMTHSFVSGRSLGTVPAPQPWNLVELHFVPEGRSQIVAVDGVDADSMPGLRLGARLPVTYSPRDPRVARLAGARTYRWREWGELAEYAAVLVAVCGGFILLQKAAGAWWRRSTRRT